MFPRQQSAWWTVGFTYSAPCRTGWVEETVTLMRMRDRRSTNERAWAADNLANFTRYADDLAFSGGSIAKNLDGFGKSVEAIVKEEGFALNPSKTRIMPQSVRQRVTGIVVNAHCNVGRAEFDRLKAILHHCATAGPESQNRAQVPDFRRHLDGRVVWVEQINPQRGAKLRALFERIHWKAKSGPA